MGEIISTDGGDDLNPFHALGLFLYPLEATENQRFSDAFRWHRKKPVLWSGLMEGVKYSTYFSEYVLLRFTRGDDKNFFSETLNVAKLH